MRRLPSSTRVDLARFLGLPGCRERSSYAVLAAEPEHRGDRHDLCPVHDQTESPVGHDAYEHERRDSYNARLQRWDQEPQTEDRACHSRSCQSGTPHRRENTARAKAYEAQRDREIRIGDDAACDRVAGSDTRYAPSESDDERDS